VSSSHNPEDSYYVDKEITKNVSRKTFVKHWL